MKTLLKLKEKISKEGYIEGLIESALLTNSHRLTYELKPDSSFNDKLEEYFSSTLKEKEANSYRCQIRIRLLSLLKI